VYWPKTYEKIDENMVGKFQEGFDEKGECEIDY